jgi:hypothetical protein
MRLTAAALALVLVAAPAAAQVMGSFNPGTDRKLPNGGRPAQHVAFPAIRDWSSLRITLTRTMCFGTCPAYTVTIAGDGTVTWTGERFVKVQGAATAHVAPRKVRDLFERFRKAEYFWLLDSYHAAITDFPSQITTIVFDGRRKSVHDYAGQMIGMPDVVSELERQIDDTADTARWIGTNEERTRNGMSR